MSAENVEVMVGLIWLIAMLAVAAFFLNETTKRGSDDNP